MSKTVKAVLCGVIGGMTLFAQAISTSQVRGTVQDTSSAAVPGAEIKVTDTATGQSRIATTGNDGSYILPDLPVGPYQLEATKDGFSKYVQTGIVLQVGSSPTIDIVLKVGTVSEQVVVEASASMVETNSSGVGQVVDQQRVVDLPLNGRNPQQLIYLAGAATAGVNSDVVAAGKNYPVLYISVAGGGSNGITYLLDGGTHNDPQNSLELPLPFPDALQEFKVETSALPAQYGQHSAAAVNAVTKSGGNEFHGDAFEFLRNGDFNARNFFAPVRDSLKRNQFGGTVGGPIKKNKIFFFVGYQGTIQRSNPIGGTTSGITTSTGISYDPTPAMLTGDFTAFESPACNGGKQVTLKAPFVNNMIAPSLINGPALNFAKTLPPGTNPCGLVQFGVPNNEDEHQGLARVDYQISDKHSVFARYFVTHLLIPPPDSLANPLTLATPGQTATVQSLVLGDTYLIGPGTVNSFRATGNRVYDTRNVQNSYTPCALGVTMYCVPLPVAQTSWIAVSGGATVGGSAGNPGLFATSTYQFADDVSLVRGTHQIGFGVNWIHDVMNSQTDAYTNGDFSFTGQTTGSGYGDLFDGIAASMKQSAISGFQPRQNYVGAYVEDSWRVTPRITINAGLRWEPFMPVTSHTGYLSNFQESWFLAGVHSTIFPNAPAGVLFPGDVMPNGSKVPAAGAFGKTADFAPRLGVIWDPKGDGRMTFRAAYGIFYDLPNLYWSSNIERQPPFGDLVNLANVSFSNPYATQPGGNPFPYSVSNNASFPVGGAFYNWPLHPKPTYLEQWNLTIQRQFGSNWLVSAGYLGNLTVHLWSTIDADPAVFLGLGPCTLNGVSYPVCSTTSNSNQRRMLSLLNPAQGQYYSTINQMDDGGTQSYNGMLLAVQHRLSKNFSLQANYTWSHCIGIPQNYELTGVSYLNPDRNNARGDCLTVDRRQIMNVSALAQTPTFSNRWMRLLASEWKASTIISAQTGYPIDITTGVDNALVGTPTSVTGTGERPNLVLGSPYPASNQSIHDYLNPAAFATPATGTFGNLGEGAVRAPGSFTIDFALSRVFPIREKQRLELRGEAFNIMNRANFLAPNGVLNTGTFGQITTAADPRIVQIAMKFYF